MTFKEFVQSRMEPLQALQLPYGMNLESVLREVGRWLIEKSGVPADACRPHAQAWLKVEGAAKVRAVCEELSTFLEVPILPTARAVWARLYPYASEAQHNCARCHGDGWIIADGPFGTSAAYPCTHQAETEADRRMGVQMHPATAARYRAPDVEAEGRRGLWVGSGGKPNAEALKNITAGKF